MTDDRLMERLMGRVVIDGECWLYAGGRNGGGYGAVKRGGRMVPAHRWVYEQHVGPIPEGYHLHHECRRRACVNPAHLRPIVVDDHVREHPAHADRSTCVHGHPFDKQIEVTNHRGNRSRRRVCNTCAAEASRRYRARRTVA